jgi:hypothetical protein
MPDAMKIVDLQVGNLRNGRLESPRYRMRPNLYETMTSP